MVLKGTHGIAQQRGMCNDVINQFCNDLYPSSRDLK